MALGHESSGHPDSVADLVAFLVSDDGHRLSGQVIPADGEIIVAAYDNEDHERAGTWGCCGYERRVNSLRLPSLELPGWSWSDHAGDTSVGAPS